MGKKKKKEERKRNKRRIRKRRRCLAKEMIEHFDDDVTTTEYFTIPRSISVCQPINSLLPFFSLFLSSHLLPRSRRFANFYNLPAADTTRAITFERISRNGEMNTRAKERLRLSLRAN